MSEWQPIETAPKDGKDILVLYARKRNLKKLVWYSQVHEYWVHDGNLVFEFEENATHWIPIPEPPN